MRFTRKHYQQNIIRDDDYLTQKDNKDQLKPEIFENVMKFNIMAPTFSMQFKEGDKYQVDEIIESANYFTILSYNRRIINCVKYDEVTNFEFYL